MGKVTNMLLTEDDRREQKLAIERMVVCPQGEFVFVHKHCLDNAMFMFQENDLVVFPGHVEEFSIRKVLDENEIDSVGVCDCCRNEINDRDSTYYRLWVLTKSDYEKNVEYRKHYEKKKSKLKEKLLRHEKWQERENVVPLCFRPLVRYIRKLVYRFVK